MWSLIPLFLSHTFNLTLSLMHTLSSNCHTDTLCLSLTLSLKHTLSSITETKAVTFCRTNTFFLLAFAYWLYHQFFFVMNPSQAPLEIIKCGGCGILLFPVCILTWELPVREAKPMTDGRNQVYYRPQRSPAHNWPTSATTHTEALPTTGPHTHVCSRSMSACCW